MIENIFDLAIYLKDRIGGRKITFLDWSDFELATIMELAQGADAVVAAHGSGSLNIGFCRPGVSYIDLLPPRSTEFSTVFPVFGAAMSLKVSQVPLIEPSTPTSKRSKC